MGIDVERMAGSDSPRHPIGPARATWDDLHLVARHLDLEGARWALVGGLALAVHGIPRSWHRLEMLVDPAVDNTARWIAALSRLPHAAALELLGEADPFENDERILLRDEPCVEVMSSAGGHSWAELSPHLTAIDLGGFSVPVLDVQGLYLTKQGRRDRDRADAFMLRTVLLTASQDGLKLE
ncbi:MAG: hypothetical protein IT379_15975 [Deltaproteobacteria bacterium]|nr:hypothetical protein [Deltaproteobacteria bacterium]